MYHVWTCLDSSRCRRFPTLRSLSGCSAPRADQNGHPPAVRGGTRERWMARQSVDFLARPSLTLFVVSPDSGPTVPRLVLSQCSTLRQPLFSHAINPCGWVAGGRSVYSEQPRPWTQRVCGCHPVAPFGWYPLAGGWPRAVVLATTHPRRTYCIRVVARCGPVSYVRASDGAYTSPRVHRVAPCDALFSSPGARTALFCTSPPSRATTHSPSALPSSCSPSCFRDAADRRRAARAQAAQISCAHTGHAGCGVEGLGATATDRRTLADGWLRFGLAARQAARVARPRSSEVAPISGTHGGWLASLFPLPPLPSSSSVPTPSPAVVEDICVCGAVPAWRGMPVV